MERQEFVEGKRINEEEFEGHRVNLGFGIGRDKAEALSRPTISGALFDEFSSRS